MNLLLSLRKLKEKRCQVLPSGKDRKVNFSEECQIKEGSPYKEQGSQRSLWMCLRGSMGLCRYKNTNQFCEVSEGVKYGAVNCVCSVRLTGDAAPGGVQQLLRISSTILKNCVVDPEGPLL